MRIRRQRLCAFGHCIFIYYAYIKGDTYNQLVQHDCMM